MSTFISQISTLHVQGDAPAARVTSIDPDGRMHLVVYASPDSGAGGAMAEMRLYGFPDDLARLLDGALAVVLADREQVSA